MSYQAEPDDCWDTVCPTSKKSEKLACAQKSADAICTCCKNRGQPSCQVEIPDVGLCDACDPGFASCVVPDGKQACSSDADCSGGNKCVSGFCSLAGGGQDCKQDSDCPDNHTCTNSQCLPHPTPDCSADTDCDENQTCSSGKCVCKAPESHTLLYVAAGVSIILLVLVLLYLFFFRK